MTYNLSQWLLLVALARLSDKDTVGALALALAVTAPVYLACGLNLRMVRATDVARRWSAEQYARLRQILNGVSAVVSMVVGAGLGLRGATFVALLFICGSKASEATSQLCYGFFQLRERLDLVARSMLLRSVAGPVGFVSLLLLTDKLWAACAGLAGGWFLIYYAHDAPAVRTLRVDEPVASQNGSIRSLATRALPLGASAGIGSLSTNVPRFAVQAWAGQAALGGFASLAYLAQMVSLITGTLGDAAISRLARHHDEDDQRALWSVLRIVLAFGLGVALVATLGAWLVGEQAVTLLLGKDYVDQPTLIVLMVGAAFITFQRSLARAFYAGQDFVRALVVDGVILVAAVGLAVFLVPRYGLPGAGAVLGLAYALGTIVTSSMLVAQRRRTPRDSTGRAASPIESQEHE